MKWWGYAGIVAVLLVGAALFIDGDPAGIVSGRFEARTDANRHYDGMSLTPEQRGAVYFATGDWSALSAEALEVNAAPWKLTTALMA